MSDLKYKKARTLKELIDHPLVSGVSKEDNDFEYEGVNDYWVYLKDGYTSQGMHCVHEWGVKRTLEVFNTTLKKCSCGECTTDQEIRSEVESMDDEELHYYLHGGDEEFDEDDFDREDAEEQAIDLMRSEPK